jgi:ketosteroid isomerase-like protein
MKILLLLLVPLALAGQSKNNAIKAIRTVMADQQEAWNRADLQAFMEGYWKSDSLKFITQNGITYGWQTTLENYRKGYPSPEAMGKLTFTVISLELLSKDAAYMIGRYHLKRVTDEPHGIFTLLWRKIDGKWVIVADHTP